MNIYKVYILIIDRIFKKLKKQKDDYFMDDRLGIQLLVLMLLILCNAFFSASEMAIISMNDKKMKKMAEEGHKRAKTLISLTREPSKFLATIQVGVTLSGFLASAFAAGTIASRLTSSLMEYGVTVDEDVISTISVLIITLLLSFITLVFGELVPKKISVQKPEVIAMFAAFPLRIISVITYPFVKLLSLATNMIITLVGGNPNFKQKDITKEEIRMVVDVGQEKGILKDEEKDMIDNVLEFNTKTAADIMTHRTDIIGIPVTASLEEITKTVIIENYTRIPVYDDTIDNIVGIVHIKDLLPYISKVKKDKFNLRTILREPFIVPNGKKIDDILKDLQQNYTHMAIVIDEYGGTAGVITMEDLVEEVFGAIRDEYDLKEEMEIEEVEEGTFLVQGSVSIDQIEEIFKVRLHNNEYDTVGGFITGHIGRILNIGEAPSIEVNGIVFQVEEVDERRITKIRVYNKFLPNEVSNK